MHYPSLPRLWHLDLGLIDNPVLRMFRMSSLPLSILKQYRSSMCLSSCTQLITFFLFLVTQKTIHYFTYRSTPHVRTHITYVYVHRDIIIIRDLYICMVVIRKWFYSLRTYHKYKLMGATRYWYCYQFSIALLSKLTTYGTTHDV